MEFFDGLLLCQMPQHELLLFLPFCIQNYWKEGIPVYCQLYLSIHTDILLANNGVMIKYSGDIICTLPDATHFSNHCTSYTKKFATTVDNI